MAFLEVKGIKKNFGETEVLKGIDFDLEKGKVLSIIGSSGSGKTTLLRCMNYLEEADEGTITLGGETIFEGGKAYGEKELRDIGSVSDSCFSRSTCFRSTTFSAT